MARIRREPMLNSGVKGMRRPRHRDQNIRIKEKANH
jgi:hypothetical protein